MSALDLISVAGTLVAASGFIIGAGVFIWQLFKGKRRP